MQKTLTGLWLASLLLITNQAEAQDFRKGLQDLNYGPVPCQVSNEKVWTMLPVDVRRRVCEVQAKDWVVVETGHRSDRLAYAGVATVLAGVLLMLPQGHDYHIVGNDYCVSESGYRVDAGACDSPSVKWGTVLAGAGAAMMVIGFQRVKITPYWVNRVTGMRVQIAWGGK